MADFPKLKDSDMADLEKYTADLANALAGKLETVNNEIGEVNQSMQDLQNDVNNNTNNILEINKFIENSMKTLSAEGTSIHVEDSADYPCTLKVEGKSEQKTRSGVNQLKITATNQTIRGITYTINEDKTVTANGTVTAEGFSSIRLVENINKSFGGYMLSGCPSGGGASTYLLRATYTDGTYDNDMGDGVILQDKPIDYVMIRIEKNYTVNNIVFKPMISETAADYEEHGVMPSPDYPSEIENVSGDLEIKVVGENLFNINDKGMNKVNCSEVLIEGNSITITSINIATTSRVDFPVNYPVNKPLEISFDATIISQDLLSKNVVRIYFRKDSQTYGAIELTKNNLKNHYSSKINAIPEKDIKLWLYVKSVAKQGTIKVKFQNIQIEVGETATEYEAYKEQSVTFPLGTQKLMKDGYLGENGVVNKRKQIVLTGQENFVVSGKAFRYDIEGAYALPSTSPEVTNGTIDYLMCNAFKVAGQSLMYRDGKTGISLFVPTDNPEKQRIMIGYEGKTVVELKEWLAEQYTNGTPVIIEYETQEEETTAYTTEQQTAYNALQKLKTYRTVTNISNNQDTNMKLSYKKDLQTQFQELETMLLESGV